MSWEKDTKHHDASGRVWWIIAKADVKGNTVLGVAMRMTGAPNIYAIAVVDPDRPDTASVLLDDGFTTIYEEDERMIDSPNAGQTCRQCRHYQEKHPYQDRFFGKMYLKDYCTKYGHRIVIENGEFCPLFLKRIYGSDSK